jgi:hypothetical protein
MEARLIVVALGATVLATDAMAQIAGVGGQTQESLCDAPPYGDTPAADELLAIDLAIRETQARLDELLLRFTDKHPDVIEARRALENLKKRRQTEIAAIRLRRLGADRFCSVARSTAPQAQLSRTTNCPKQSSRFLM